MSGHFGKVYLHFFRVAAYFCAMNKLQLETARKLYLEGLSFDDIGQSIGRSARTVRLWAQKHGWADLKRKQPLLASQIAERIEKEIEQELGKNDCSADRLAKLSAVLERFKDRATINFWLFEALKMINDRLRTKAQGADKNKREELLHALQIFSGVVDELKQNNES